MQNVTSDIVLFSIYYILLNGKVFLELFVKIYVSDTTPLFYTLKQGWPSIERKLLLKNLGRSSLLIKVFFSRISNLLVFCLFEPSIECTLKWCANSIVNHSSSSRFLAYLCPWRIPQWSVSSRALFVIKIEKGCCSRHLFYILRQ